MPGTINTKRHRDRKPQGSVRSRRDAGAETAAISGSARRRTGYARWFPRRHHPLTEHLQPQTHITRHPGAFHSLGAICATFGIWHTRTPPTHLGNCLSLTAIHYNVRSKNLTGDLPNS